ncbi:MAG: radical SAM protein [Endomicrobiales bacterium]|nr:radical SAM protein [Endomicrobiales bacterium]
MNNVQPALKRKTPPHKVFFTWEITYACNFDCTYCHAPKHGRPNVPATAYPGLQAWKDVWDRMYAEYGGCEIVVSGGEPFYYPDFTELALYMTEKHIMEFTTNLSWDVAKFERRIEPKRARFGTSFHPQHIDIREFIKKANVLRMSGYELWVNFVPWPPFLPKMREYKDVFEKEGMKLVLQPFLGDYEGKRYPQGYTGEEKMTLGIFTDEANVKAVDFKTTNESIKKGKLCRMGENYAFIHPDGGTDRCCRDKTVKLGNVLDGTFRLLDEPQPCRADECNCWRCMLVETEPDWVKYWGRPDNDRAGAK